MDDSVEQARNRMLHGWLADLDGDGASADDLLDQAGALLVDVTPEHYMRRELARYRETRVPGGTGGTMIRQTDVNESAV
ncbi:MAG: hypothetical protein GY717_00730 [Rhodobacteraceae bacterium]|nr:hypothetical protein [Paracoccaceae bacterium]